MWSFVRRKACELANVRVPERLTLHRLLNVLGMSVVLLGVHGGAALAVLYVLPVVCAESTGCFQFNYACLAFGIGSMWLNWLMARLTDTSARTVCSDPERPNCAACQIVVPEGAHHCNVCGHCVAVRDHHCFFLGACVGGANRRPFVVFCFWMAICTLYSLYVIYHYFRSDAWNTSGRVRWFDYIMGFTVMWRWLLGYISLWEMCCLVLTDLALVAVVSACTLLTLQTDLLVRGLTFHERKKRLQSPYQHLSVSERVRLIFGDYWPIHFILPIAVADWFKNRRRGRYKIF